MRAYRLLPDDLARLVAYGLPVLEVSLGLMLLLGVATRLAAVAVGVLLIVFIAGIVSAAVRGLQIDCGCFGGGGEVGAGQTRYGQEIARDLGLLALCGFLVARPRSRFAVMDQ